MLNRRLYNLVGNTRISDTAKGLYDKESHINTKYLLILKFKSGDKCYHCNCDLDWDNLKHTRRDRQVTLQRIDNTKGHIKGNCQFACFSCNVKKRMENREMLLNRFDKNKTYTYGEIRELLIKDNLFT